MRSFPTMHGRCVVFITSENTVFANYPSYVSFISKTWYFQSHSAQLSSINIFLSHDWPQSIEQYGDLPDLLNRKSFLRQDIDSGTLGSPPLMGLLRSLKPQWWFAAHMHTRYEARVVHESRSKPQKNFTQNPDEILIQDDKFRRNVQPSPAKNSFLNPDEITLYDEEATVESPPPPPSETRFLALDKCLPRRQFLEVRIQYVLSVTTALNFFLDCWFAFRFCLFLAVTKIPVWLRAIRSQLRSRMARNQSCISSLAVDNTPPATLSRGNWGKSHGLKGARVGDPECRAGWAWRYPRVGLSDFYHHCARSRKWKRR